MTIEMIIIINYYEVPLVEKKKTFAAEQQTITKLHVFILGYCMLVGYEVLKTLSHPSYFIVLLAFD